MAEDKRRDFLLKNKESADSLGESDFKDIVERGVADFAASLLWSGPDALNASIRRELFRSLLYIYDSAGKFGVDRHLRHLLGDYSDTKGNTPLRDAVRRLRLAAVSSVCIKWFGQDLG